MIFRILLVVPVVYILLNTPFYLLRITDTIALYVFQSNEFSIIGGLNGALIIFLYNTAHYLYYISFACDVIVYAFSRFVSFSFCRKVELLYKSVRVHDSIFQTNLNFSSNFRKTAVIAWRQIICPHSEKTKKVTSERYRSVSNRLSKLTGENISITQLQ